MSVRGPFVRVSERVVVPAILVALLVFMTWPLAAHLGTHVVDLAGLHEILPDFVFPDIYLTIWLVARAARTVALAPLELWDAGIFRPAPHSIGYTEHMLGVLPITLPAYWLGQNPIFAHQVLLLATFVLSALGMAALVGFWTGSSPGALVAGAIYGLAPWRFRNLIDVHVLCTFYLPFIVLFSSRYLLTGRRRDLVLAGVSTQAQLLCAYSLAYPVLAALPSFAVVHALAVRPRPRRLVLLLGSYAVAALVVVALSGPYLAVMRAGAVSVVPAWEPEVLAKASGARLADWMDGRHHLFVGWVPLVLALLGFATGLGGRGVEGRVGSRAVTASVLAFGAVPFLLSFGPQSTSVLAWLWDAVPGLAYYRVPWRFGFVVSVPIAVLSGVLVSRLHRASRFRRGPTVIAWGVAAAILTGLCAQVWAPFALRPLAGAPEMPAVYVWLRDRSTGQVGPVLEVPVGVTAEAAYVYWTVYHHQPLVNGYSGYAPAAFPLVQGLASELPGPDALETLRRLTGLRWLVVHLGRLSDAERTTWESPGGLTPLARFGDDLLFQIGPADADWRGRYVRRDPEVTFAGTKLAPLDGAPAAGITVLTGPSAPAGGSTAVRVAVENVGRQVWPALAPPGPFRVVMELSWAVAGGAAVTPPTTVVIPRDLAPGERVTVPLTVRTPPTPGDYRLLATVAQGKAATRDGGSAGGAIRIVPGAPAR